MKRQVYEEEAIVTIILPESVQEEVRSGNVDKALQAPNFPAQIREMELVSEYVSKLTFFQRGLLADALVLSLRESHGAQVAFSLQDCGYALEGPGIEIRNDTVMEDESRPPDERQQPMKIIFAVNQSYDQMR